MGPVGCPETTVFTTTRSYAIVNNTVMCIQTSNVDVFDPESSSPCGVYLLLMCPV